MAKVGGFAPRSLLTVEGLRERSNICKGEAMDL